jgi:SAM-dependent methyltransferase
MGRLFGMDPAPLDRCRVLELGCGDGGNLIPMAYTLPGGEFLGVDLGAAGIAAGQKTIEALGLRNAQLLHLDILDAGAELGKFDYILAHGVFSWVPAAVQNRILEICRENLNPQGVAYISYSVYPGAHLQQMIAGVLRHHVRRFADPRELEDEMRALLSFLSEAAPVVRQEAEALAPRSFAGLFHDELAPCRTPLYFSEFAARATAHGLQYLGEADFFEMLDLGLSAAASQFLRARAADPIEKEQYLDFLKGRRFRQTLLCHSERTLNRGVGGAQIRTFYIGVRHRRTPEQDAAATDHPVAKAALGALTEAWPDVLSFAELKQRIGAGDDVLLGDIVLALFSASLFQLHAHRPRFAERAGKWPRASALARSQVLTQSFVTNLCHQIVHLEDGASKRLLRLLDGTRDRGSLLQEMRAAVPPDSVATLAEDLERSLAGLAKLALLEE